MNAQPKDKTLSFFTYGLFQPGEPGHELIKGLLCEKPKQAEVRGELFILRVSRA